MSGQGRAAGAEWNALGTLVRLVVTDSRALPAARALLADDLSALDLACSRFRPDSELMRLDQVAGQPQRVSALLAEAIGAALDAARATDGDVDPTVGRAMVELGYDLDLPELPADGPRVRVVPVAAPGWERVHLDRDARVVTVPAGVLLDLGATAKAWAADRAASRIAAELGTGVLVGLGGDLGTAGVPPAGGWQVRVQHVTGPVAAGAEAAGPSSLVSLHHGGLATSSTAARRWVRGGQVLHHLLDPRTCLPAPPVWRTVSVAAATALDANTASTAAVIRGRRAPGWLERLGVAARLVACDGEVVHVGAWPADDLPLTA